MATEISEFDHKLLNEFVPNPDKQMERKFTGWFEKRKKKKIAHWGNGEIYKDINIPELIREYLSSVEN